MFIEDWKLLISALILLASIIMIIEGRCAINSFWSKFLQIAGIVLDALVLPMLWAIGIF